MFKITTIRLCIIAIIILAFASTAMVYAWFDLKARGIALADNMQVARDKAELEQQYRSLNTVLESTQRERQQLKEYILESEDGAVTFLSIMDTVAEELGVELETKSLTVTKTDEEGFDLLEVSFNITGEERSSTKMLQLLETVPYHGYVAKLSTKRTTDSSTGQAITEADITMHLSIIE